jgi:putative nucleotidyltransferase with HDIG domain
MLNREAAWALLNEYTTNPSLIKHALAVEAAMRAYARKFGEDEELWGITGLLHDFDYEKYPTPEEHPFVGSKILREKGYPEEMIRAILGHANYSGVPRDTLLAKALFACDELSGFITAVALVRPTKSIFDVDVKAVKKKLKDKAFAKGVNREDVKNGPIELGVDMDEHIQFVIDALKEQADALGLRGVAVEA